MGIKNGLESGISVYAEIAFDVANGSRLRRAQGEMLVEEVNQPKDISEMIVREFLGSRWRRFAIQVTSHAIYATNCHSMNK